MHFFVDTARVGVVSVYTWLPILLVMVSALICRPRGRLPRYGGMHLVADVPSVDMYVICIIKVVNAKPPPKT